MEHFTQSPGLGLREREEELRWLAMMEWIFLSALRWILAMGRRCGLDLRIPIPLIDNLFIWLGGEGKNALAPRIRSACGRKPLLGTEAKRFNIYGAGHYLTDIQDLEKNPPCNAEDNTARRTHRH